jgi:hypothetical protein
MKTERERLISTQLLLSLLCGVTAAFLMFSTARAASPANATLAPSAGSVITWNGTAVGPTQPGGAAGVDLCVEGVNCETFTLTLSGATTDWAGKQVHVNIGWLIPVSDYDLYIYKDSLSGPEVGVSATGAPSTGEDVTFDPTLTGAGVYVVHVIYFTAAAADQYHGTATVQTAPPPAQPPAQSTATPPTYTVFRDPQGRGAAEPSIGVNWLTGAVMFLVDTFNPVKITFNDKTSPATATWETKPNPINQPTSLDPILYTDRETGRTFSSQLAVKTSFMSYSDDDGDTWNLSQGSGVAAGVDHQTVGGGPFVPINGINPALSAYPHAVYYASQDIALAEASVSLDGGVTFGPSIPMYELTACGGIHGHVKVAPDGTAYIPNKDCGGQAAVVVSENDGLNWTVRPVPGSSAGQSDPSVGIGTDGTLYIGWSNGDGRAMAAVSRDKGVTWTTPYDVGFYQNTKNSVFPAVVAGDGDRAAFYFLGTSTPGGNAYNNDKTFTGAWYAYIATTYDRGQSWVTVNATPNDPVQRGPICTQGTTCSGGTRNLLDFNDITVDKQGHVLASLADGCTSAGCIAGDANNDGVIDGNDGDYSNAAAIIRLNTGLGLFHAYDPPPPPVVIEDTDARVEYSDGWHQVNDTSASAGHFRIDMSKSSKQYARLAVNVTGSGGVLTYNYAKSPKGGTAEMFLDGASMGTVNFNGPNGSNKAPEFGSSIRTTLTHGPHLFELRNINGPVYVDKFILESASSDSSPSSGPGTTSSNSGTVSLAGLLQSVTVPAGAQSVSVATEGPAGVPLQIVLIDPSGLTLATGNASPDGIATIDLPVTGGGTYKIKTLNLGVGPIQVSTLVTPRVAR